MYSSIAQEFAGLTAGYAANSALDRGGPDEKRRSPAGALAGIIKVKGKIPCAIR